MKRTLSLLIVTLMIVGLSVGSAEIKAGERRVYKCDYKSLNINTKITTTFKTC